MKLADYIIGYLKSLDVKYVFGITGSAIADTFDRPTSKDWWRYLGSQLRRIPTLRS